MKWKNKSIWITALLFFAFIGLSGCATSMPPSQNPPNNTASGPSLLEELKKFREQKAQQNTGEGAINEQDFSAPKDPFAEKEQVQGEKQEQVLNQSDSPAENPEDRRPYTPSEESKDGISYEPWFQENNTVYERLSDVENYMRAKGGLVERVYFDSNSAELNSEARSKLKKILPLTDKFKVLLLVGHSSTGGSPEKNRDLSFARAQTVGDELRKLEFDLTIADLVHAPPTKRYGKNPEDNQLVAIVLEKK